MDVWLIPGFEQPLRRKIATVMPLGSIRSGRFNLPSGVAGTRPRTSVFTMPAFPTEKP